MGGMLGGRGGAMPPKKPPGGMKLGATGGGGPMNPGGGMAIFIGGPGPAPNNPVPIIGGPPMCGGGLFNMSP